MLLNYALALLSMSLGVFVEARESCSSEFARIKPKCGSLVVDATGKHPGSYQTFSLAVDALNYTTKETQRIFIFPGVYTEQVYVKRLAGPLIVQGYTCDSRSYIDNQVHVKNNLSRLTPGLTNNDQTGTIRLHSKNVKVYNLNVANTSGKEGAQALALSAQNTDQGYYGCQFRGYQDTVLANEGRQVYAKSYVNGAVDFIFGARAKAWFEQVDIETIGSGWVTANGRDSETNPSFYVFNQAKINGTSGTASVYLGRPWRPWSRVVFQNSELGDVIRSKGWDTWGDQPTENIDYAEYQNFGPGAAGTRAPFSKELDAPVRIEDVMGEGYATESWIDTAYL